MWVEIIVMPREAPGPQGRVKKSTAKPLDRRALHDAGCQESQRFRDAVVRFLEAHHLMGAVKWISEPGSLPQVTLVATARVLEQLRKATEFEAGLTMPLELQL